MKDQHPQIIVPMAGIGERFRRAGYRVPKPLIEVEGKPIIRHVVEMFPGASDFTFICNRDQLADSSLHMRAILEEAAPGARILSIEPGHGGPIPAILHHVEVFNPERPALVSYCDFTNYWSYPDFLKFVRETRCDGAVPAYRGFHPHSLGSTYYAYLKETGGWMLDIQEKKPFTEKPMQEYASSGAYYFATASLMRRYCEEAVQLGLNVGGEAYVSLAYKPMARDKRAIAIYELAHFMQWGTPEDLREYIYWSDIFHGLVDQQFARSAKVEEGMTLIPMAGLGQRFSDAGYDLAKPLIPVSGMPMAIQATLDMPATKRRRFVMRNDMPGKDGIVAAIRETMPEAEFSILEGVTDGQARTCLLGLDDVDEKQPLTITACDNGVLFDMDALQNMTASEAPDVVVWCTRAHPQAIRKPNMFGWVDADDSGKVTAVSAKQPLSDPATDPVVIGAFTFRRAADFIRSAERMISRQATVNGEYYVDVAINDAIALGLDCRAFIVDAYVCWGTPDDLRTFEYWQSCFDKWKVHPYALDRDSRVAKSAVDNLRRDYAWRTPGRPDGRLRP